MAALLSTAPPAHGQSDPSNFTTVINAPPDAFPVPFGDDTQINLGGEITVSLLTVGSFNGHVENQELNVNGAFLNQLTAYGGATVNLADGGIGRIDIGLLDRLFESYPSFAELSVNSGDVFRIHAEAGTRINVRGGTAYSIHFDSSFRAAPGVRSLSLSGGVVRSLFVDSPTLVEVSGGVVEAVADIRNGSQVNVTGGSLGRFTSVYIDSNFRMTGGAVGPGLVANGVGAYAPEIEGGEFLLNGAPFDSSLPFAASPDDEGVLTGTLADGSPFIFSGLAGDRFSSLNLIAVPVPPIDTAPVTLTTLTNNQGIRAGQSLTVVGGGALPQSYAAVDASLTIAAGVVGPGLEVARSELTISGGEIGVGMHALPGSVVHVIGGGFKLDGVVLGELTPGVPTEVAVGDQTFEAVLRDGAHFWQSNFLHGDARLLVTLEELLPGDFNVDGVVDAADYAVWRDRVGQTDALLNDPIDGVVGDPQYEVWKNNYGATVAGRVAAGTSVPEPGAAAGLVAFLPLLLAGRRGKQS